MDHGSGYGEAASDAGSKGDPSVSVVIPAHDEGPNLYFILPTLPAQVSEVILVDAKSSDVVDAARRLRDDTRIVRQAASDKDDGLSAGYAAASGDIVVTLDADGSVDPEEIPRLVEALRGGADLAKGTRFTEGGESRDT